ncbi:uncharacterized protein LOC130636992 [Hydractinia symbiolongicarpus]|uniref:uncharacterized protein LOC130636992 n=1 Tax=Hydractinia symbiolongicarpus TaxID=13093 RepID=UPI00254BBD64|nr:uncharacterized protein LOC130636992 [Hydractinia symbiolongicarpus]
MLLKVEGPCYCYFRVNPRINKYYLKFFEVEKVSVFSQPRAVKFTNQRRFASVVTFGLNIAEDCCVTKQKQGINMKLSKTLTDVISKILETVGTQKSTYYTNLANYVPVNADLTEVAILPNILVWDPISHLSDKELHCPHCMQDDNKKSKLDVTGEWDKGLTSGRSPRIIWDFNWHLALIGRMYQCSYKHKMVSYHSGILNQIHHEDVPFVLSHDSGMMKTVFDSIVRLVENGNNFAAIERILSGSFLDHYFRSFGKLKTLGIPPYKNHFKSISPSDNLIKKCFVMHYQGNVEHFDWHFHHVQVKMLSCDHTFKCAANIGYEKNGRWVMQFDSVFIILNEMGKVKNFRLTKGTSFEVISSLFEKIAVQAELVESICIDNCCHWRNKLQEIFPKCSVKLDLFHAIQRLTKTLSKKHPFFHDVCREVGLIFRQANDLGTSRKKSTASIEQINNCLDCFVKKWQNINYNGWNIFNANFYKEVKNLKHHISLGCVSNIQVGMGTNRNERLHRELKSLVKRNKLGVQTAISLLAQMFYIHNCRIDGHMVAPPIWSIEKNLGNILPMHSLTDQFNECHAKIDAVDLAYESLLLDKSNGPTDHNYTKDAQTSGTITLAKVLLHISSKITKELSTRLYRYQGYSTVPTENWSPLQYYQACQKAQSMKPETLQEVLTSMQLTLRPSTGCIYNDLFNVMKDLSTKEELPKEMCDFINGSLSQDGGITSFKTFLANHLQEFKSTSRYNNCIEGEVLDNSMSMLDNYQIGILTFGDAFGISVVVIPSCLDIPILPLIAKDSVVSKPVFVLYDGVKDAFFILEEQIQGPSEQNEIHCSCGKNDKDLKKRCVYNYRCKCFRAGIDCSLKCTCKGCHNSRPSKAGQKRRRRTQPVLSCTPVWSSFDFLHQSDYTPAAAPVTTVQHFLLESCLFFLLDELKSPFTNLVNGFVSEKLFIRYQQACKDFVSLDSELLQQLSALEKVSLENWIKGRKRKSNQMHQLVTSLVVEEPQT